MHPTTSNMASLFHHFLILSILIIFSSSQCESQFPKSGYITLPTKLDPETHQYYTSIGMGTPRHNMNLVIALDQNALWYDCNSHYNSSSYIPVSCNDSTYCPETSACYNCHGAPHKPGCTDNTCGYNAVNPFVIDTPFFSGDLGQDLLYFPQVKIPRRFHSGCVESDSPHNTLPLLGGLVKGSNGMLGFGRNSQLSLPIQVSSIYNVIPKFAICLPSSEKSIGNVFIGGTPYALNSVPNRVAFSIPAAPDSNEYFINANSIKIDGELVHVSGKGFNGTTKISTMTNFTVLHSSIFKPFVKEFVKHATAMKMKRVRAVEPFGACFDGKSIGRKNGVPDVPRVNLVLDESQGVSYEINGHNSMFAAKKDVMCFAFVDGGKQAKAGIVLGGYQMEDRILEFDLSTSILRFSDSLLLHNNASCSNPSSLNF